MKLIGLISPNSSDDTLVDVYKIFPEGIRIEARTLHVSQYTDDEFQRAEQDRKSTRLNSSHIQKSRMPSSA